MPQHLRLTVTLAALAILPLAAHAQRLEVKAGYAYGSVPNSGGVLPGKLSAHSGVALGIGLVGSAPISWGIEGLYAERGFNSSVAGGSQRLHYVDVPAYLRLTIPSPGISPFAYAGPQASFELNCDAGGGACPSGRAKTTWAGVIGGGARLGALGGISLEGRYLYGLTDTRFGTVTNRASYKTRSFMVLAGFSF